MCYPKPGPRCSSHAAAHLQRTRLAKKATPFDFGVNEAVDQALLEYDATPAGQKELNRRIAQEQARSGKPSRQLTEYQLRLELGLAKRAEALAAIRANDIGDMAHTQAQPETTFPPTYHQLRQQPYDGTKEELLQHQPAMVELLIADSQHWTAKLTPDEVEAASWYTSNGSFVVNQHLTDTRKGFAGDNDRAEPTIEALDSALAKSNREKPIRLYRGISREVLEAYGYDERDSTTYVENNFKVGATWSAPVFQSTTLDYQKARGFARSGVVLEILAKHAAPVSNVSAWSYGEAEYIVPRNQQYRVVNVQHYVKTLHNPRGDDYTYNEAVVQLEEI